MKIKVLHVIGGGEFGGAEQHILELLTILSQKDVDPVVVCFYNSTFAQELRSRGIPVIVLDIYKRFDFRLIGGLTRVFQEENPDLIHTHGVKANFFSRLAARSLSNVPLLTTIHSILRYDYPNPMAYFLASRMEFLTRKWNDHYIAISRAIMKSLESEGVAPGKISLIHHGIALEDYQQANVNPSEIRRAYNIPESAFVVGTVSRMVPVKGLHDLMEAMEPLVRENPDIHWLAVGDGPEKESLEAEAARRRISDHVHFTGFRKDIPRLLQAIDVFVSPSYSEGLGLSLLEAMTAKKPVISTLVGGIQDFLVDYETGIVIPVHEPEEIRQNLLILKEDSSLREKLAESAYEAVLHDYTLTHMAERTKQVYEYLITRR